jgi:gas vesicle protein
MSRKEFDMEDAKESSTHMITTFTAGAMLGVGLGLLFAPKKGTEMMADIRTAGSKTTSRLREAKDNVRSGLKEAFRSSKETAKSMKDQTDEMMPVA